MSSRKIRVSTSLPSGSRAWMLRGVEAICGTMEQAQDLGSAGISVDKRSTSLKFQFSHQENGNKSSLPHRNVMNTKSKDTEIAS